MIDAIDPQETVADYIVRDSQETVSEMTAEAMQAETLLAIAELRKDMDEAKALLTEIMASIAPTLDSLKKSPILKMLGV